MLLIVLIKNNEVQIVSDSDFVTMYVKVLEYLERQDTDARVQVLDLEQERTDSFTLEEYKVWIESVIKEDDLKELVSEVEEEEFLERGQYYS